MYFFKTVRKRRVVEMGLGEVQSTCDSPDQFHMYSAGASLQHLLTLIVADTICVQWRTVLIFLFTVIYPTCFGLYSAIATEIIHVQHGDCVLHAITLWYCIHSWIQDLHLRNCMVLLNVRNLAKIKVICNI
jgi:hypothetical protein